MKKLVIGADSAGYELKEAVKKYLESENISYDDLGCQSADDGKAYYDTACEASEGIVNGKYEKGILFCGTGMGMSIVANKHQGISASCVESIYAAAKCRAINNANVLCMGGFIVGSDMGIQMVKAFLNTEFTENMDHVHDFLVQAYKDIQELDKKLHNN